MSFEDYWEKAELKWIDFRKKHGQVSQETRDRFYQLYMAYTNERLVFATWALAIATIILTLLTLYLQYG